MSAKVLNYIQLISAIGLPAFIKCANGKPTGESIESPMGNQSDGVHNYYYSEERGMTTWWEIGLLVAVGVGVLIFVFCCIMATLDWIATNTGLKIRCSCLKGADQSAGQILRQQNW